MPQFGYDADGVRLYAIEEGQGSVIIMLHGGGGDHRACLPFVTLLSSRYRIVAPDLRGSGKSWCAGPLSWDRFADDVGALLDHIGARRAVVVGISMGAGVALRFAGRFPGRAAGLVMVLPAYAGQERGLTPHQADTFASLVPVIARAADEGVEAFRPLYQKHGAGAFFDAVIESLDLPSLVAINQFMASGVQPFVSGADLEAIAVPTLLIPGNDPMHPAEIAEFYAARIPRCCVFRPPDGADYDSRNKEIGSAIDDFCAQTACW
jgi:3-oxoadipate enol-lactonase